MPPDKTSELRMGYMLFNCVPKGLHGDSDTSQTIGKAIGYALLPDGKTLLLKTKLSYVIEHEEVGACAHLATSPLLTSIYGNLRSSAHWFIAHLTYHSNSTT